jgi:hypothetical protein
VTRVDFLLLLWLRCVFALLDDFYARPLEFVGIFCYASDLMDLWNWIVVASELGSRNRVGSREEESEETGRK